MIRLYLSKIIAFLLDKCMNPQLIINIKNIHKMPLKKNIQNVIML